MSFCVKQQVLMRESRGQPHVYAVSFPDPTKAAGVREEQARGMRIGIATHGGAVRNDFDRVPIFQRPIFNATWSKVSQRWVNFVPLGDGAFSWSPTEEGREVVYRCQPFWYKLELSGEYAPLRVSVADRPLEGFVLAPMFRNGSDYVYRPVFEMTVDENGIPHSRAGAVPLRTDPVTLMNKVSAYDTAARLESVRDWFSDMLLQLVEFATWNIGAHMPGNNSTELAATGNVMRNVTASLGDLGAGYGCVWRGKENPWKNVSSCLCDLMGKKITAADGSFHVKLFYLPDMKSYTGTLNAHYTEIGTYLPRMVRGYSPVGGWEFSKQGILFPSKEAASGVFPRAQAYLATAEVLDETAYLLRVGVGGGSTASLLPTAVTPSPFHWEVSQRDCAKDAYFGGRLVLDEAQ